MDSETFTLRTVDREDGTIRETEITAGQALDLGAGKPICYFPRDETTLIDEHGQITQRETAVPQYRDEAA